MSISIIIPTKNEEHNLPKLLRSILNSSVLPRQVIIVDNHSTDHTLKVAKRSWQQGLSLHQLQGQSLELICLTHGIERSVQKNFGAKKAKSTHLLFLDADMEISKKLIGELQTLSKKLVSAAIIPEKAIGHDLWGNSTALERNCYRHQPLLEAPRFFHKKVFEKIGGFDPQLIAGEDWDIAERLRIKQTKIKRTKQSIIHHQPLGLYANLKRKWYYTLHISDYAKKNPYAFARQSNLKTRLNIYCQNFPNLIKHPIHTLIFLLLKLTVYIRWKLTQHE